MGLLTQLQQAQKKTRRYSLRIYSNQVNQAVSLSATITTTDIDATHERVKLLVNTN